MINVFVHQKEEKIFKIIVTGHANSNEYGQDLVCAGVSAIVFGIANCFVHLAVKITTKDNYFEFLVMKNNQRIQQIFSVFLTQLNTIKNNNKKNIKISIIDL